jgi:hypothetical protein
MDSNNYNAAFSLYAGNMVAGGNPQLGDLGGTRFCGLLMGQNQQALPAFDTIFKTLERAGNPLRRIIELGTSHGGLSVYLQLYCLVSGAQLVTYDRPGFVPTYIELFGRLGVDYRAADVLGDAATITEIGALLSAPGRCMLLCDNGDKVREFALYARFLKPDDLILAHDYCENREVFQAAFHNKKWSFCEITEADIHLACRDYHLSPFLQEVMAPAAWVCRCKQNEA